mgnify:CR=1 FL=1
MGEHTANHARAVFALVGVVTKNYRRPGGKLNPPRPPRRGFSLRKKKTAPEGAAVSQTTCCKGGQLSGHRLASLTRYRRTVSETVTDRYGRVNDCDDKKTPGDRPGVNPPKGDSS